MRLYAWEKNGRYCPKKCDEDLQDAIDGEEWYCSTGMSRKGKVQWEYGVENYSRECVIAELGDIIIEFFGREGMKFLGEKF